MGRILSRFVASVVVWQAAAATALPCEKCHSQQSHFQPGTPMAHALSRATESEILRNHPDLRFRDGKYAYQIKREANQVTYSVQNADKVFSAPLLWAFGLGSAGQTFVYEYSGALYESRVSYFSALAGLDITVGHKSNPLSGEIAEAAGRRLPKLEASRCFGCHAAVDGEGIEPGVQCDRCHLDAKRHASTVLKGTVAFTPPKLSQLDSEDMSTFCGQCHRTWEEIAANGPHNVNNVRFQPYRLTLSKCYEFSPLDKRIRCTACHDPHQDVVKDADFYDAKCQTCHSIRPGQRTSKICPKAQANCVSCHMPKVELTEAHFRFTDHRIRMPHANEPYQD
jgi:hypothetical protein